MAKPSGKKKEKCARRAFGIADASHRHGSRAHRRRWDRAYRNCLAGR